MANNGIYLSRGVTLQPTAVLDDGLQNESWIIISIAMRECGFVGILINLGHVSSARQADNTCTLTMFAKASFDSFVYEHSRACQPQLYYRVYCFV